MSEQTVFQLRLTVEQKERWRAAANGTSLSEWIRDVCDWAASAQNPYRPGFVPVKVIDPVENAEGRTSTTDVPHAPVDNWTRPGGTFVPLNPDAISWPSMLPPEEERPHFAGIPIVADPDVKEGTIELRFPDGHVETITCWIGDEEKNADVIVQQLRRDGFQLPSTISRPSSVKSQEKLSLASDCVNAHLHWALKQNEACRYCKGTL